MKIIILAIGRMGQDPTKEIYSEYMRRIPWANELKEFKESTPFNRLEQREKESTILVNAIPADSKVVALHRDGKMLSSNEFAVQIREWRDLGAPSISFLIGGAEGHSSLVLKRADLILSFGPMVWPHLMARVMLSEQLWRSAAILTGHPYHRV